MSKKIYVRPGKGQSKIGFAVGIVFCLIGVFVVIPTFGLFDIIWTAGTDYERRVRSEEKRNIR